MLKIALVSDHASPLAAPGSIDCGGQNVYVANLAKQLAQLGYQVDVFTRRDSPSQRQVVAWQQNIRVIHLAAGPAKYVPKEDMLPYMTLFADEFIRFTRRQKAVYDIIHANFFMSGVVAQQVRKVLGIPYVITFHALGKVRRLSQGAADGFPSSRIEIEHGLINDADCIIAECPQDRIDMQRHYGATAERIKVVPCGFDPLELWPVQGLARRKLGLDPDKFILLQLGRMVPRKGVDNVIESLAVLRDGYGIDAQLLVVGGDLPEGDLRSSPELARLLALAAARGLQDQITFTGQKARAELLYYYSAADVFVTTPWYEPFGITPLEAMACATPVVGAAVGGIKSTVVDGQTGYLVPPRDPHALAARLATLHDNPALARQLGQEGLRRAYLLYTWRSVAEQIASIYETVVENAGAEITPSYQPSDKSSCLQLERKI